MVSTTLPTHTAPTNNRNQHQRLQALENEALATGMPEEELAGIRENRDPVWRIERMEQRIKEISQGM